MIVFEKPGSVVFFVREIREAGEWYSNLLGLSPYRNESDFIGFHIEGIDLCFHRLDKKAGDQSGSQVAYWQVVNLEEAVKTFVDGGGSIYRKAFSIPEGGRVIQMKDPFGNILGLIEMNQ